MIIDWKTLQKIRAYGIIKRLVRSKEPHSKVLVSSMFLHYYVHYRIFFFLVKVKRTDMPDEEFSNYDTTYKDLCRLIRVCKIKQRTNDMEKLSVFLIHPDDIIDKLF